MIGFLLQTLFSKNKFYTVIILELSVSVFQNKLFKT